MTTHNNEHEHEHRKEHEKMSHMVAIKTEVRDLAALGKACEELGIQLVKGQTTFKWWGRWVDDYAKEDAAYKLGIDPKDYGKCAHAIRVPGTDWEIGLIRNDATGGYKIAFDFFGSKGKVICDAIGRQAEKLLQLYGVQKATIEARRQGYTVQRQTMKDGAIKLTVNC